MSRNPNIVSIPYKCNIPAITPKSIDSIYLTKNNAFFI